jgi:hypothetical protein
MTLYDLRVSLFRKLGFSDEPATEVVTRLTGFLNEIHRRVLGLPGMEYLRQSQTTFASVADTAQYSMPPDVARIIALHDTTNDVTVRGEPWAWYAAQTPDPADHTGIPEIWVPVGQVPYAAQPSNASKLYVDSTSASDTSICYVEGTRTGGYPFSSSVTMTGATAVQVGDWTDILAITKFYLSASAVGSVTLTEDAEGGTELARIPIGQTHARYLRIALWPTPSSVNSYTLDYQRQIEDMEQHTDEPLVPRDFHWVIAAGARMLEYEKQDDRRYPAAKVDFEKGVRDLRWFVTQQADGRSLTGGQAFVGSRLGPWYPRGT